MGDSTGIKTPLGDVVTCYGLESIDFEDRDRKLCRVSQGALPGSVYIGHIPLDQETAKALIAVLEVWANGGNLETKKEGSKG